LQQQIERQVTPTAVTLTYHINTVYAGGVLITSISYNQFGIATYDKIRTQIDSQPKFSPWRSIINGLKLVNYLLTHPYLRGKLRNSDL